jgi:hypothetical protein
VAYRRFFTLACFVCGLTAAGCGGGAGTASRSTTTTTDDTPTDDTNPPANRDQAPTNKDQPPRSTDQATSGSPGALPSAGDPMVACLAFCTERSGAGGCPGDNPANAAVRAVCGRGCMLDAQQAACQAEAVAAFNCIMGLAGLCTANGPTEANAAACEQAEDNLESCEDAHKPAEMPTDKCTMAGGCLCGDDECKACQCILGGQSATCTTLCN